MTSVNNFFWTFEQAASYYKCAKCSVLNSGFAEGNRMDTTIQDTVFFFNRHQAVYPLYACFQEKLRQRFPNGFDTGASVNRREGNL